MCIVYCTCVVCVHAVPEWCMWYTCVMCVVYMCNVCDIYMMFVLVYMCGIHGMYVKHVVSVWCILCMSVVSVQVGVQMCSWGRGCWLSCSVTLFCSLKTKSLTEPRARLLSSKLQWLFYVLHPLGAQVFTRSATLSFLHRYWQSELRSSCLCTNCSCLLSHLSSTQNKVSLDNTQTHKTNKNDINPGGFSSFLFCSTTQFY